MPEERRHTGLVFCVNQHERMKWGHMAKEKGLCFVSAGRDEGGGRGKRFKRKGV